MTDNTALQRLLLPDLISVDHQCVIDFAHRFGALGVKVNGAGGKGGSVSILCGLEMSKKREMVREIEAQGKYRSIPVYLSKDGVRVWSEM
jgi:D-glycero-alpha-D-manno-heptose-7-phosphate kinase